MTYNLKFVPAALKEWKKLGSTLQIQFKNKLQERLRNPHIDSARLSGANNIYKIKLRSSGYRLVYSVHEEVITVLVLGVGRRQNNQVYTKSLKRIPETEDVY